MAKRELVEVEEKPAEKPEKFEEPKKTIEPISVQQFIKLMKEDMKGKDTPLESVLNAFKAVVPPVATGDSYRKVWQSTFKRQ